MDNEEAEPLDSPEPIAQGEPIEVIGQQRRRENSLQANLAELKRQENEMRLKLKILATKEKMGRMQEKLDEQALEDSFYNDLPDKEGYRRFRTEKWEREFEELVIRLKQIEDAELDETITIEEATEAKKVITKEIKRLKSIKSNVNTKNRFNKLRRGIQKTMKGINSVTKGMGKLGDSMGQGQFGQKGGEGQSFENFFSDRKTTTKTKTTTKKRRKSSKKSSKTKKKRRKSRRKKTTSVQTTEPSSGMGDFFKGI